MPGNYQFKTSFDVVAGILKHVEHILFGIATLLLHFSDILGYLDLTIGLWFHEAAEPLVDRRFGQVQGTCLWPGVSSIINRG